MPPIASNRLGEMLVRENLISASQLLKAQEASKANGGRLSYNLTKLGFIQEKDLTSFLSKQFGVPAVDLSSFEIDSDIIALVPKNVAEKHGVMPVNKVGSNIILAMSDPSNIFAIDDIKFMTGFNVEAVVASEESIRQAFDKYYNGEQSRLGEVLAGFEDDDVEVVATEDARDGELGDEAPVVKLVNLILLEAVKKGASDIHVEPYEKELRIRYRVDGVLIEQMKPPVKLKNSIVSRIKIMAQLDIAERRLPQDGRIKMKYGKGKEMDFRVSVLPTLFGEKVVLRLLDKGNLQLDMTKLGFEEKQLGDFKKSIHQPFGMVLVTGPTGSGKTTTLYSALSELNQISENISTAEDPVEFNLMGINQVQMHEDIGLNFAAALRSFLRQDPDIIMVGEIRDLETAEITVRAALTGHLVLSTMHTNDAISTIARLKDLGMNTNLIMESLLGIVAQRLVRKICSFCAEAYVPTKSELTLLNIPVQEVQYQDWRRGRGCEHCFGSGYLGREAIFEILNITPKLRKIINTEDQSQLAAYLASQNYESFADSVRQKVSIGVTTLEESLRVLPRQMLINEN